MERLAEHPPWCERADCHTAGMHVSQPVSAGNANDLVGIEATLLRLDAHAMTLVQLALTDDDVTTVITVSGAQAEMLNQVLGKLLSA
ncbi:hypothetical protein Ais01nite_72860 [Asanoa ishikariensis]|uniref:Uncharacterized protein n=1 Tax=Asanoa ishikariensis TaxID=137265 RepID=A0A1H3US53_9ACTN|nr:hypothetical protein [Asanoa ishikariensis]GIF69251.1 hypothetical protein Ais01nite_72860 [Asanoa ishikariensis]SDZ64725.1 hypothetical protein SAMN05421684_7820 [Asanoa ishikariensis]